MFSIFIGLRRFFHQLVKLVLQLSQRFPLGLKRQVEGGIEVGSRDVLDDVLGHQSLSKLIDDSAQGPDAALTFLLGCCLEAPHKHFYELGLLAIHVADQVSEALLAVYLASLIDWSSLAALLESYTSIFWMCAAARHVRQDLTAFFFGADVTKDGPPSQAGLNWSPGG